jgi:O-antigen ligase
MQITNTFRDGAFPSSQGGGALTPDVASQIRKQRLRHRLIWLRRTAGLWWYRILLIALVSYLAPMLAPLALANPKVLVVFAGLGPVLILVYWIFKRLEFGLLATAVTATAFFPTILQIKSLAIAPAPLLVVVLFAALLIQVAFHVRKPVWPSFYALWPVLGLIVIAIVSQVMIQFTWTHPVPHKINTNPIYYDEIFGVALFFYPFMILTLTTAALTNKDKWIEYIKIGYMATSVLAALIIIVKFKSINATIYTFRFSTPMIGWMSLRALAQLLGLGTMLGWAHFLHAKTWRRRLIYGAVTGISLAGVYLALENSWWLEVGLALVVITFVYSRKLSFFFCLGALPLLPLVKYELAKLQQVKSADYYRLVIWQDALRVWKKQPIFGVGPGNFWAYDQFFTQLPVTLRNCNKTGLCVAHNGYLQVLVEMGPLGLFFWLSFIAVIAYISYQLFRRSNTPETVADRILGLVSLGLVIGSAAGDFFAGSFFMQPRQIGGFNDFPQVITSWIIWGCVMYKDQLWRIERRRLKKEGMI